MRLRRMDLRAQYTNCLIAGCETTSLGSSGEKWSRNHIPLSLGPFRVDLYQRDDIVQGDFLRFKGQSLITTEVFVRDVDGQNESEARSIAQGLASLLGFLW